MLRNFEYDSICLTINNNDKGWDAGGDVSGDDGAAQKDREIAFLQQNTEQPVPDH
jgi:hypothetical protein